MDRGTQSARFRAITFALCAVLALSAIGEAQTTTVITVGQTINGTLSTTTPGRSSGCPSCFADIYQFTVASQQTLSISLTSTAFDPFLRVRNSAGTVAENNDENSSTRNSRIVRIFTAGTYQIEATTLNGGQTGAYSLSLQIGTLTAPPPSITSISPPILTALTTNQTVTINGNNFVGPVTVSFIWPEGPGITGSVNSVTATAIGLSLNFSGVPGPYTVRVINADGQQSNTFAFTVHPAGAAPAAIGIGQTVNGTLATTALGRRIGCPNCFADVYQFTVASTQSLVATMSSSAFDAFLQVTDASGALLTEDDDGGGGTNARVTRSFTPGTYRILATSFAAGQTGAYSLSLQTSAPAAPVIHSLSPATPVALTTNQTVTINGANFQGPVDVFIEWPPGPGTTGTVTSVTATAIVLSLNFNGVAGPYTIRVTNTGGQQSNVFSFTVLPNTRAPVAISVGQTVNGTLTTATPNRSVGCPGCYADLYQFTLASAQLVTITLSSTTFDAFLRVIDSAGATVAEDDDGGGNQNSRISRSFAAGTYRIEATTYSSGMTGSYTLSLQAGSFDQPPPLVSSISPGSPQAISAAQEIRVNGAGFQQGLHVLLYNAAGTLVGTFRDAAIQSVTSTSFVVSLNFNGVAGTYSLRVTNADGQLSNAFTFTAQSVAGGAPPTPIGVGQSLSGVLTTATPNRSLGCSGCFTDLYQLTLPAAQTLTINLTSTVFDTFLRVIDAAGAVVATDDDGGEGTNSRITRSFAAGTYRIEATTYSPGSTGSYTISIQSGSGGSPAPVISGINPAAPLALAASQNITVNGSGFQTGLSLALTGPGGAVSGVQITHLTPASFVMAVNLNGLAGGYSLRVTNPDGQQSAAFSFTAQAPGSTAPPSAITIGQTVNGTLSTATVNRSSGCAGCFTDLYQFTLTTTQTLTITLNSTAFDAFLRVLNSSGGTVAEDDDSGGGTDSRIVRSFSPGTYRIEATTYSSGQVGAYRLQVIAVAANQSPPAITAVSPGNLLSTLSLQHLTVTGTGFQTGLAVAVTPPAGGTPVTIAASRITGLSPTSFVMAVNFNGIAGSYSVRVTNPDGQQSNAFGFTVASTGGVGQPGAINIGQTVTGTLNTATVNRSVRCSGCFADLYRFTITTTQTLTITQTSAAFDSYLLVLNAAGSVIAEDDDSGGGVNARISRSFTPGTYRIEATTYAGGQSGAYSLSLHTGGAGQAAPVINSITPASPFATIGAQNLTVAGTGFQSGLTVTLTGPGAPATISGAQIQSVTATSFIMVANFNGAAGGYSIRVNNPDGQQSNPLGFTVQSIPGGGTTLISIGQTVNGTLSAATPGRSVGCSGCFADRYEFSIGGDQALTISMNSTAFDAFLRVLDAAGNAVATDDDSGGSLNAQISRTFSAGTYRIEATTYAPATGGPYTLSLGGGGTSTPAPFINAIDPANPAPAVGNQPLRVLGGNFQPGLRAVLFTQAGTSATLPVLTVLPGSFTVIVNFNGVAGGYAIRAINPDGQQSEAYGFAVAGVQTAVIDAISPASPFATEGSQNLVVFGRNLQSGLTAILSGPEGREIVLQGAQIRNLTSTSFVLVVDFANLGGRWELRVVNPDGQESNRFALTVRPPVIACTYSISPARQLFRGAADTGSVGVVTNSGCRYNVTSNAGFLTVTSGATLTGSGTVTYNVAANGSTEARTGTITIADKTLTVTQSGTAPVLLVSPAALSFRFRRGGTRPDGQIISVFTNGASVNFSARSSTTTGANWLALGQPGGASPASLNVTVNPDALAPGRYEGTVTVEAPAANPATRTVAVVFEVEEPPPQLSVEPRGITLTLPKGSTTRQERLVVSNVGGGFLPFRAGVSMTSGDRWLSVSPEIGSVDAAASASVIVTADARGLIVGTYRGQVNITALGQTVNVPVTIVVNEIQQSILLSQTGLTFIAVSRGGTPPSQNFGVINDGEGIMDWSVTATALSGRWLSVSPASGRTDAASLVVPLVDARVDPSGLPEGDYYGQIAVSSPTAKNSPQFISVVLSVLPPGSDPGPVLQPTGLIFTGVAGGPTPASQTVSVTNLTDSPKTLTFNPGYNPSKPTWFTTDVTEATIRKDRPATLTVTPDTRNMEPGIRRGSLTLLPTDDSPITIVSLLLVLIPRAPAAGASADESCTPTELYPVFTSLGTRFQVSAAWPYTIQVRVVDNCGNPLTDGSVVATFTNNDPALRLVSLKDGRWSGTWQGRNVRNPDVTITVAAESANKGIRGLARLIGGLAANTNPPLVAADGVSGLSPGTVASISGTKLAEIAASASPLPTPLPFQLGGTTVTLGGRPLPLFAANEDRLDVLIPYDMSGNTQHQLLIRRGNSYAVPEPVTVASAQPVIYAGQIQVLPEGAGPFVPTPETPATAGNRIIVACGGLGAVNPPVAPEMPVPEDPVSETVNRVTLTIGGVNAQVESSRLAPGMVGIYWVTAIIPAGVPAGDAVPVVATVAGQSSAPVPIVIR